LNKGKLAYIPYFSLDNPNGILFDELWLYKGAIDNHFKQPYVKDLLPEIEHLLAKPLVLKAYSDCRS
jgi:quinol monooxygenase YgiN